MTDTPETDVPPAEPTSEATKPARRRRAAAASEPPEQPAAAETPATETVATETPVTETPTAEAAAIEAAAIEAPAIEAPAIEAEDVAAPASPPPAPAPEVPPAVVPPAAVTAEIGKVMTADPMASALKAGQQSLQTQSNALAAYVTLTTQWTQQWQSLFGTSLKLQQQIARQVMESVSSLGALSATRDKKDPKSKR